MSLLTVQRLEQKKSLFFTPIHPQTVLNEFHQVLLASHYSIAYKGNKIVMTGNVLIQI